MSLFMHPSISASLYSQALLLPSNENVGIIPKVIALHKEDIKH